VSWFSKRRARTEADSDGPAKVSNADARRETMAHLEQFNATRVGVEAYIEPPTNDFQTTLLLIATTGEWTRRKVPDAREARDIAAKLGMPIYDVNFTGYPQRMRDWNAAQRAKRRQ
jgi:hypothetical protein